MNDNEPNSTRTQADAIAPDDDDSSSDPTAAAVVVPQAIVAQSLGEFARAWVARVRGGDAGVLPVAIALVAVAIVFTIVSPNNVFLSAGNLVNLFDQSAVFIVLAMGQIFVLLLGEIDLSIGYVAAIGGIVAALLVQPDINLPWWVAIIAALVVTGAIGGIQGLIITKLGIPAFVVTLAGYLIWFGVMIQILGSAGASASSARCRRTSKCCTASCTATSIPCRAGSRSWRSSDWWARCCGGGTPAAAAAASWPRPQA